MSKNKQNKKHKQHKQHKKEVVKMKTTAVLRRDDADFVQKMNEYVKNLHSMSTEDARKEAEKALKRSGVTTKKGTLKKNIVSWE